MFRKESTVKEFTLKDTDFGGSKFESNLEHTKKNNREP